MAVFPLYVNDDELITFWFQNSPEVYDTSTFGLLRSLEAISDAQPGAVSAEAGKVATFSGQDLVARVFDLESGEQLDVLGDLEAWPQPPYGLSFSPSGERLAAATPGRVLVWDLASGEQTLQLAGGSATNNAVFSPDGATLLTAHSDGVVRIWSLLPGGSVADRLAPFPSGSFVNGNRFSIGTDVGLLQRFEFRPDGPPEATIEFFSTATGEAVGEPVVAASVGSLMLPDDRAVLLPGSDPLGERFHVIDPETGASTPFGPPCPDDRESGCVLMQSEGTDEIAIVHDTLGQPEIYSFDQATLEPRGSQTLDVDGIRPFALGETWVYVEVDGSPTFVSRRGGEELFRADLVAALDPSLSQDGRFVVVGNRSRLEVIDTDSWRSVATFDGLGAVRGTSFSADNRLFAIADEDELLIADLSTGEFIQEIPFGLVSDIHWIDESEIFIVNRDGSLRARVPLDLDVLIDRARRSVADRPLTTQECSTYRIDPCPTLEEVTGGS